MQLAGDFSIKSVQHVKHWSGLTLQALSCQETFKNRRKLNQLIDQMLLSKQQEPTEKRIEVKAIESLTRVITSDILVLIISYLYPGYCADEKDKTSKYQSTIIESGKDLKLSS